MIQFPVLTRLEVKDYELYPGPPTAPNGLKADFLPGLSLVLGANGLGKSTLVAILFRMLTGDADLRGLGARQMGSGQIEVKPLQRWQSRTFADRVDDSARNARATLEFMVGTTAIRATRDLNSLSLVELVIDDVQHEADEDVFQRAIVDAADVESFLSWLLLLRYLVFFSDERLSLVWDASAQRRLLPLLFLTPSEIRPIDELTKEVLSLDSTVRNLGAALTKQELELKSQELALISQPAVQAELEELIERRARAEETIDELHGMAADAEDDRARARLNALRADDHLQSIGTKLEELRLADIRRAFPTSDESITYVLAHLLAEETCLVCGTETPEWAAELAARVESHRCAVCNSGLPPSETQHSPTSPTIEEVRLELEEARFVFEDAAEQRTVAEDTYTDLMARIAEADREISATTARINRLERSLPESDRSISRRRDGIAELRVSNNQMRDQVLQMKEDLTTMIEAQNQKLSGYKDRIKSAFERHARGFLLEQCSLVWGSNIEKIGQLGPGIAFSVFHVDMTGGARHEPSRRDDANEVSESQREFIDLAFRMALISVSGDGGVGSLIMDAPESSLDAVFAPRAAEVLTRFGEGDGRSRIIVTSNLVDGQLIPKLAARANIKTIDDPRVINLFDVAAPTAAVTQLKPEYDAALERVFNAPGSV